MTGVRKPSSTRRAKKVNSDPQTFDGMMSRPKEALVGLCFLALGLIAMAIAIHWIHTLVETLRSGNPVVETRSTTFGFPLGAAAMLGLGVLVLLGAARSPWVFRHLGALFGAILTSIVFGILLMVGGDLLNGLLLRHQGYELCDSKSYYRMTTKLWALQGRDCDSVEYGASHAF